MTNTKLIQGDVMDGLASIESNSIDMVFADPPFNINKPYMDRRENYQQWCYDWMVECFRVLKDTGTFYLMTLSRHLDWKMPIMAKHGVYINLVSWKNTSAIKPKRSFGNEYQPIMGIFAYPLQKVH